MLVTAATVGLLGAGLAGCGSAGGASAARRPTTSPPAAPTCPAPTATPLAQWPAGVPADLPKPPGARLESSVVQPGNLRVTRFATPTSFRDGILFVLNHFPKAGFVLGRGDEESGEADVPFARGSVRAAVRMLATATCRTEWLLVTTTLTSGGPPLTLLPSHSPSASVSPLPFGTP